MKLHTDTLTLQDLEASFVLAKAYGQIAPHMTLRVLRIGPSNRHKRAIIFDLRTLTTDATPRIAKGGGEYNATWDEYAFLIARIFDADPHARVAQFASAEAFHAKTWHNYGEVPQPDPYPYQFGSVNNLRRAATPPDGMHFLYCPRNAHGGFINLFEEVDNA